MRVLLRKLTHSHLLTKFQHRFWKIHPTKGSSLLTTFIIPLGKYCHNVLAFGISRASEHYQKVIKENLIDCEGTVVETDDIFLHMYDIYTYMAKPAKPNKNMIKDYVRSLESFST